jgi:NTE family protein
MVKSKLGFALGGGAARGYAHIGILKVLEENGCIPDIICGTSMGAVIGGLYAYFESTDKLIAHLQSYFEKEDSIHKAMHKSIVKDEKKPESALDNFLNYIRKGVMYGKAITSQSVVPEEMYKSTFDKLVPDVNIEDLNIPLGIIVTELITGEELLVTEGSLKLALMASSAIPGVYPPLFVNDMILVDGGWTDKTPVNPCKQMGAAEVVAVCVSRELDDTDDFTMGMDIVMRANAVTTHRLAQLQKQSAEAILFPEVSKIHWADFSALQEGVEAGVKCAVENLNTVKKLQTRSKWTKYIKQSKKCIREIAL